MLNLINSYNFQKKIILKNQLKNIDKNYYDRQSTKGVVVGGKNMISSDVIRGYTDTMILYLLLDEDSYGYEISKRIREITEEKYVIKETTLYSAFSRLEKNGYIKSVANENTKAQRRTYYRITDEGLNYYKEKCEEWEVTKEVVEKFIRED